MCHSAPNLSHHHNWHWHGTKQTGETANVSVAHVKSECAAESCCRNNATAHWGTLAENFFWQPRTDGPRAPGFALSGQTPQTLSLLEVFSSQTSFLQLNFFNFLGPMRKPTQNVQFRAAKFSGITPHLAKITLGIQKVNAFQFPALCLASEEERPTPRNRNTQKKWESVAA